MSTNKTDYPKEQVISILKEWASPALIGIVGMLLWRDVTEMRSDVKLLLTQQSADRVKIEQLEDDVKLLKTYVFTANNSSTPSNNQGSIPENQRTLTPMIKEDEYSLQNSNTKKRQ